MTNSSNQNSSWFLRVSIEEGDKNLDDKVIVSDLVTLNAKKIFLTIGKKSSQHITSQNSISSLNIYTNSADNCTHLSSSF